MRFIPGLSHMDHGFTAKQHEYIVDMLGAMSGTFNTLVGAMSGPFWIGECLLPNDLGTAPCALIGPLTGEPEVLAGTFMAKRGNRPNESRMVKLPPVPSARVTVIAGYKEEHGGMVVFTAYPGPLAPQEPTDPYLKPEDRTASEDFWSKHALSAEAFGL